MNRTALLGLSILGVAAPAFAGDVTLTVTGVVSVVGPAPTSGAFQGVAVGDLVAARIEVFVPGTPLLAGQSEQYTIDGATSTLTVGSASDTIGASTLLFLNDFPVADGFRMFGSPAGTGGNFFFEADEQTGTIFSSTDIEQELGTWPASTFGYSLVSFSGSGGFFEADLAQVTIATSAVGATYCAPAVANSSGAPATIAAFGSTDVSSNLLTLVASAMPQSSFGYFLCSRDSGLVAGAGGSQGTLCLGGAVGRFNANVLNSGTGGRIALAIDLTDVPQPTGAVAVQPGETWRFQAWFRDANPAVTSNFTDAVEIVFL